MKPEYKPSGVLLQCGIAFGGSAIKPARIGHRPNDPPPLVNPRRVELQRMLARAAWNTAKMAEKIVDKISQVPAGAAMIAAASPAPAVVTGKA